MKSPIVCPAASADIEDAYQWYEAQQAGLGEEFLVAADEVIKAVVANPLQFPVIHRQTRRALLHRFPYGIFTELLTMKFLSLRACTERAIRDAGSLALNGAPVGWVGHCDSIIIFSRPLRQLDLRRSRIDGYRRNASTHPTS